MSNQVRKPQLVTAPTKLPVSLEEVKNFARIEDDNLDAEIEHYTTSAVEEIENAIGVSFITRTYAVFMDTWPSSKSRVADEWWAGVRTGPVSEVDVLGKGLFLPRGPIIAVDHVKTYDDADTATVWASTEYFVDTNKGRLVARVGAGLPYPTRTANGIEIQYQAGYGTNPSSTPQAFRTAIIELALFRFENRGDTATKEPTYIYEKLKPYRKAFL